MSNYGESFRQNIQCVVQESGYTVQEFSKSIGLDDKTIYNFLEGYCLPRLATLEVICDSLGCTPDDLLLSKSESEYYLILKFASKLFNIQ